jgi:hypothetical protein
MAAIITASSRPKFRWRIIRAHKRATTVTSVVEERTTMRITSSQSRVSEGCSGFPIFDHSTKTAVGGCIPINRSNHDLISQHFNLYLQPLYTAIEKSTEPSDVIKGEPLGVSLNDRRDEIKEERADGPEALISKRPSQTVLGMTAESPKWEICSWCP